MTKITQSALDRAFSVLEAAAIAGERCPCFHGPKRSPAGNPAYISALARAGRIRVEISSRNWRRVTLLTGLHAGKSTAPNPDRKARPYQIIDRDGARRVDYQTREWSYANVQAR